MEDLIKNLKAYFDSATKEQLEKDWEELEPYSHIGPEIFSFLDEQYKQMKDFKLTINERNLMKISKKSHKSLACVDELRIFLDISFVISKLFCTFVI